MKKFEKIKEWFKNNKNEMICGVIIAGTAVGAFWLGGKVCELQVSLGLQKLIEHDGVMALTKPHKKGEPIVEIGCDEWIKMMQERKSK